MTHAEMHYHLSNNHFPPIGDEWIPTALAAIEAANNADPNAKSLMAARGPLVDAPESLYGKGAMIPAWQLIENMHLEGFLS